MKYKWHDGFTFEAADASQVIAKLRAGARFPDETFDEYKSGLAFRASQFTGRVIRPDTAEGMIEDLKAAGLLTELT